MLKNVGDHTPELISSEYTYSQWQPIGGEITANIWLDSEK